MKKCVDNDLTADFLITRVPNKIVFSEQAIKTFQRRLLKDELRKAKHSAIDHCQKTENKRSELRSFFKQKVLASVVVLVRKKFLFDRKHFKKNETQA